MNRKDSELKIRCTCSEKKRITNRAASADKSLSEFTREMLLTGKVTSVPKFTEAELKGIHLLKKYEKYFTFISNYMRTRDGRLYEETRALTKIISTVIEHFFSAKTDEK